MPNNNEEQKPVRKTWTMLMKASPIKIQEIKQCPYEDINWTSNGALNGSGTNKLGTWTCTASKTYSGTCKNAWTSSSDMWAATGFKVQNHNILQLPDGVEINPTHLKLSYATSAVGSRYANYWIMGYNPATSSWETILSTRVTTSPGVLEIDNAKNTYYTKLRVDVFQYASGSSDSTGVKYLEVTDGTLRINYDIVNKNN